MNAAGKLVPIARERARAIKRSTWGRTKSLLAAAQAEDSWRACADWAKAGYAMPAPEAVKWAVLHRYGRPTDTWVETGTFTGNTTAFLARSAQHVYSIEPAPLLAERARARFADNDRVTTIEGLSEERLESLLASLEGSTSFWLDGHFSGGSTFKGPQDTPIVAELTIIEEHLVRLNEVTVLVDDVRCFDPSSPGYDSYPSLSWLVNWADANELHWTIEHDIFAARRLRA